ncbi:hypothetical protein [Kitasatospora sp. NPDC058397]|uniref:hypothetical protein n=1 Tax=unclassified Kitasatospora TaxID=2633591 RepID=UPI003658EFAF
MLDAAEEDLGGLASRGEFAAGGCLGEELAGLVAAGFGVGEDGGEGGPGGVGEDPCGVAGDGGAEVVSEVVDRLLGGLAVGEGGEVFGGGLVVGALQVLDGELGGLGLLVVATGLVPAAGEDRRPDEGGDQDGEGVAAGSVAGVEDVAGGPTQVGGGSVVGAYPGVLGAGERAGGGL